MYFSSKVTLHSVSVYRSVHIVCLYRNLSKKICNIKLNKDITNIEDFTFDDIELIDYDCHPLIKGKVSV